MAMGLTACDNNAFMSPLSVQRNGDLLLVAMCGDSVSIERIYVEARNLDEGGQWQRFWDASGVISLKTGDIVSFEHKIDGFTIDLNENPPLSDGTQLAITMVSIKAGKSLSSDITIRGGQLSEDSWLHADGSVTDAPCI
jgi:hypothetical protein